MKCQKCGQNYNQNINSECPNCKTKFMTVLKSAYITCPNCKTSNGRNRSRCISCGGAL